MREHWVGQIRIGFLSVAALSSMWGGIALSWIVTAAVPVIAVATLGLGLTGSAVLLFWVRTSPAVV